MKAIDLIGEMLAINALRNELLATIGATADKGGAYRRGYNAAGDGTIGIMAGCAVYQLSLIKQMIARNRKN